MLYKQLFEFNIFHDYYQNKVCPDLSIEPTTECSKILSGHRLIIKNKLNGIAVIAPVESDNKLWIDLANNLRFTFILKFKNKDFIDFTNFPNYTDLADVNRKSTDYIYRFVYDNQSEVEFLNSENVSLIKIAKINLLKNQNIFGIVDIKNNASMPISLAQVREYKLSFSSKKQKWYYYVVTDQLTNGDEFLIEHNDTSDTNTTTKITFTKSTIPETERVFSILKQRFPQSNQFLFESDSEIPCQEAGKKNIQLVKKKRNETGNSSVWIKHLPNPPNHNGIQVINALKYF